MLERTKDEPRLPGGRTSQVRKGVWRERDRGEVRAKKVAMSKDFSYVICESSRE